MTTLSKLLRIIPSFLDEGPKMMKTKQKFQKTIFLKMLFRTYRMSFYGTFRELGMFR